MPRMSSIYILAAAMFLLLASQALAEESSSPAAQQILSKRKAMYMCKCTCFSTNSTVVPLFAPADPSKPCSTCTRKFCLDQGLEICKGAKLEAPDHDTGTGYEGDVWARCFQRDSYKDQTVVSLYVFAILGLLIWAFIRPRLTDWAQAYREGGPLGVYKAVRTAPWTANRR